MNTTTTNMKTTYEVRDAAGAYLMVAPVSTIVAVFGLREPAVKRIESASEPVQLFRNYKDWPFITDFITVSLKGWAQ